MHITRIFKKYSFEYLVLKKCYYVKDILYPQGKESRIQQTIPSQYIYVAELDTALNGPLFLPMNNIEILNYF